MKTVCIHLPVTNHVPICQSQKVVKVIKIKGFEIFIIRFDSFGKHFDSFGKIFDSFDKYFDRFFDNVLTILMNRILQFR